jgi:hypothetical protein
MEPSTLLELLLELFGQAKLLGLGWSELVAGGRHLAQTEGAKGERERDKDSLESCTVIVW